ncbi:hypothetical protein DIPPA_10272 [Diplonema papillatum]|nr:hypothetical protein DIPPA_10272 [Diplonema papillatum]
MSTNDGDNDVECCVSCGGLFGWPTLDFRTQMCSACYADAEAAKRLPEVVIVTLDLMENPVLGAVLNTVDGQLIVVRTEPGTEAAKRGIMRGMALVRYAIEHPSVTSN